MNDGPRYASLRDYLQVVRNNRVLIVVVTLALAGGAYWFSSSQTPSYLAEASISLDEAARDSDLVGVPKSFLSTPEQRATLAAEDLGTPAVTRRVKRRLRTKQNPASLRGAVTGAVDARSNLLVVQARWPTAKFGAKIANAYARASVREIVGADRRRYARTAKTLRRRYAKLKKETRDRFSRAVYLERVSRIEALADFARAAQVVRRATPAAGPTSPKPVRDAVLGGVLGLVLALIAAFVRDALDRRVRLAGEIEEEFDLPVLGQVRDDALGKVPFVGSGKDALSPADLEAFRILRSSIELLEGDGPLRVVLVTSPLPEEGKSTVATALAAAAASAGRRTLLLESDLRRPTLARRTGLAAGPGLSDILAGKAELRQVVQTVALSSVAANQNGSSASANAPRRTLDCLTAGTPTSEPAELLRSPVMERLLTSSTIGYDLVVVDTSPLLPVADTLGLLPHADVSILCMRTSSATHEEIRATKALLERVTARIGGLVITGLRPSDAASYGYYPYAYTYAGDSG